MLAKFPNAPAPNDIQDFVEIFERMAEHNVSFEYLLEVAAAFFPIKKRHYDDNTTRNTIGSFMQAILFTRSAHYIATDAKDQIHWIHPAFRAFAVSEIGDRLEGAKKRRFFAALARLDARHAQTEQLRQSLLAIPPNLDAMDHYTRILAHIEEAKACPILVWNLLRLHTPVAKAIGDEHPHFPQMQAEILSHCISPQGPAPEKPQAMAAYVTVCRWHDEPGTIQDITTTASAMCHGILPKSIQDARADPDCEYAELLADICAGTLAKVQYDRDHNPIPILPEAARKKYAMVLGTSISNGRFSAHQTLTLLNATNGILDSIGMQPVTLQECLAKKLW